MRGFHRFLALEGEAASDPAGNVAPPTPPGRLPKAIPIDAVERLLAAASVGDTPESLRDRALLEVLYGVGARISEAVGLDVDDLDTGDAEHVGIVRLLGKGELKAKLALKVAGASKGAREAVEKAGGSIEIVEARNSAELAAAKKGKVRETRLADKADKVEKAGKAAKADKADKAGKDAKAKSDDA